MAPLHSLRRHHAPLSPHLCPFYPILLIIRLLIAKLFLVERFRWNAKSAMIWLNSQFDWLLGCVFQEYSKPLVKSDTDPRRAEVVRHVVYTCFDIGLRLLHPFMPFVTEELFQRLPRRDPVHDAPSLCVTAYPDAAEVAPWMEVAEAAETQAAFQLAFSLVHRLRSLYSTYNIRVGNSAAPETVLVVSEEATLACLRAGGFLDDLVVPLGKCRIAATVSNKADG